MKVSNDSLCMQVNYFDLNFIIRTILLQFGFPNPNCTSVIFFPCFVHFMLIMCDPIMHVTGMDRRRDENLAMHASVKRERREKMEPDGLVPKRRGGRTCCVDADDEPQPQVEPVEDHMDIEHQHQLEDDDEAEEDMVDDDDSQQQQWRGSVCRSQSLRCWMTILVAHMTLLC